MNVTFQVSIESVLLPLNLVIPLALIINEIISNSYKHAFHGKPMGTIKLDLVRDRQDIVINVSDDGIGLPGDFNEKKEHTLGIQLIELLTSQIKADLETFGKEGVSYQFRLKGVYG